MGRATAGPLGDKPCSSSREQDKDGAETRRDSCQVLKRALNIGESWGLVIRNAGGGVDLPKVVRREISPLPRHGLIVVEGFNDVIGLDNPDNLGIPAVAILSNRITASQVEKITRWSRQLASGKVTLLFDCEQTGDDGAREALWLLAQRGLNTRLGCTQAMHGGAFIGRQPENLTRGEWDPLMLASTDR